MVNSTRISIIYAMHMETSVNVLLYGNMCAVKRGRHSVTSQRMSGLLAPAPHFHRHPATNTLSTNRPKLKLFTKPENASFFVIERRV